MSQFPDGRPGPDTLDGAFAAAVDDHRAGRYDEAERSYRRILERQPNAPAVVRMLALAIHRSRRDPQAIELLERAIGLAPNMVQAYEDLSRVLRERGDYAAAIAACRRGLEIDPGHAGLFSQLAISLRHAGALEEAVAAAQRAVEIEPNTARHHSNLGNALAHAGHLERAVESHRHSIELDPLLAAGFRNLGMTLATLDRYKQAEVAFRRWVRLTPDEPSALVAHGTALTRLHATDEAEARFRRAIEIDARSVAAWDGLAAVLGNQRRWPEAEEALREADRLQPQQAERLCRLSVALEEIGQLERAREMIDYALALAPDSEVPRARLGEHLLLQGELAASEEVCRTTLVQDPDAAWARFALGHLHLLQGRLRAGFADHEARWRMDEFAKTNRREDFPGEPWDGGDPAGKTVLLWAEQGLGDAIQFARFAPVVADRGVRVVVAVQRPLLRLMRSLRGVDTIVERARDQATYDLHCPLLGLPHVLGTELDTIPASPYLSADPALAEVWRKRLEEDEGLHVGLAWAGNPDHKLDRQRSLPLDALTPLLEVRGAAFYSLQKGVGAARARKSWPAALVDRTDELDDLADTAAFLVNLDLVISVDTSVAHLAGAIGVPIWVLLPYVPDSRWLLERKDCPWYASARLFRQPRPLDWSSVIEEVRIALAAKAGEVRPSSS